MKKIVLLFLICIMMIACSSVQYISKKESKEESFYSEQEFIGVWELYAVRAYGKREKKTSDFEIKLLYYLFADKSMRFERYNFNNDLELTLHGRWELDKKNKALRMIFVNGEKEEIDARYIQSLDKNTMILAKIPSEETQWIYKKAVKQKRAEAKIRSKNKSK